jgi:hypothetical protein
MISNREDALLSSPELIACQIDNNERAFMFGGVRNHNEQMIAVKVRRDRHQEGIAEFHAKT